MRFAPGRLVLHRHFTGKGLAWAPLVRVVSDDERGLLVWLATGTPVMRELSIDGENPRDMPFAEWITLPKAIVRDVYRGPGILKLIRPGTAHSVWWLFKPDGAFAAWYVNLEEPSVRWDDGPVAGIDVTDHDLDIWVWPDRTWKWKDEDELAERLRFPDHYWVTDPDAVWAEGRRVITQIEVGGYPFDGTLCDFRPDPSWALPDALPDGWDRPRAVES
jgi:hypothetical protein